MSKRTEICLRIQITDRDGYDTVTVLDRDIKITVPPGQDPMTVLRETVDRETTTAVNYFFEFPRTDLIEDKS